MLYHDLSIKLKEGEEKKAKVLMRHKRCNRVSPASYHLVIRRLYSHCPPLFYIPLMVPVADIWTEPKYVSGCRRLDISIPQVRKSVLVPVNIVVVLPARCFDGFEEMNCLCVLCISN